ncbi:hypothetical protein M422DRAFT_785987 [Sphaerobolus stellatus SS14]|uniref:Uncharacterized protein n=1 Tax=Sphaerobolus stellatus (strain SS14) TaxID=990650 RepID=A0A0C9TQ02_SPHS4|nr:hypothetical protein M422DRAFT_785987 [Sphaerobolus stellatus SS14]
MVNHEEDPGAGYFYFIRLAHTILMFLFVVVHCTGSSNLPYPCQHATRRTPSDTRHRRHSPASNIAPIAFSNVKACRSYKMSIGTSKERMVLLSDEDVPMSVWRRRPFKHPPSLTQTSNVDGDIDDLATWDAPDVVKAAQFCEAAKGGGRIQTAAVVGVAKYNNTEMICVGKLYYYMWLVFQQWYQLGITDIDAAALLSSWEKKK